MEVAGSEQTNIKAQESIHRNSTIIMQAVMDQEMEASTLEQ